MKRINLLSFTVIALTLTINTSFAQTSAKGNVYIEPFDDGRVLNSNDIRFLNSISDRTGDREAIINGKKYSLGQHLTSNEAAVINFAKSRYRKNHPMEKATDARFIDKTRGTLETCDWYTYCTGSNVCYNVWYCD